MDLSHKILHMWPTQRGIGDWACVCINTRGIGRKKVVRGSGLIGRGGEGGSFGQSPKQHGQWRTKWIRSIGKRRVIWSKLKHRHCHLVKVKDQHGQWRTKSSRSIGKKTKKKGGWFGQTNTEELLNQRRVIWSKQNNGLTGGSTTTSSPSKTPSTRHIKIRWVLQMFQHLFLQINNKMASTFDDGRWK